MNPLTFSALERKLALLAGLFNLVVGLAFFFLPELKWAIWPVGISTVLTRFIGAIILGNAAGAFWLPREREWAHVRALAIVAVVYGTLVAISRTRTALSPAVPARASSLLALFLIRCSVPHSILWTFLLSRYCPLFCETGHV